MMLLVEIAQCHRVGEQLVEVGDTLYARRMRERDRHPDHMPVRLNLMASLVNEGARVLQNLVRVQNPLLIVILPKCSYSTQTRKSIPSHRASSGQ